jgi:DNA polymerase beta
MNKLIIEQFNLLVKQIQSEFYNAQVENDVKEMNMHSFRLKTVKRIVNILKNFDEEITNVNQLKGIPGVGAGTIKRVKEILDTGHLSELEGKPTDKKQAKINAIQELEEVIGIGPAFAKELITKYKITSIDELKKAYLSKKIKLNDKVLLGLKYHGVVKGSIPRTEVAEINKYLEKVAHKIDSKLEIVICGSYRRGKPTSGDIDVLMYHPDVTTKAEIDNPKEHGFQSYLEEFVDTLEAGKFLLDHMTDKDYTMKYMGFCKYKNNPVRRIDIRWFPYKSYFTAMLYFTGPYELNTDMRSEAKKRGMILNEYGLYKIDSEGTKKQIKITSEKDVFDKLGMTYLTPEQRELHSAGKAKRGLHAKPEQLQRLDDDD